MLFQIENNAFLKDTANKDHVINDVSTEFKKAGCNAFHSSDDADIDYYIIKLIVLSSLNCLVTVIGENKIYL